MTFRNRGAGLDREGAMQPGKAKRNAEEASDGARKYGDRVFSNNEAIENRSDSERKRREVMVAGNKYQHRKGARCFGPAQFTLSIFHRRQVQCSNISQRLATISQQEETRAYDQKAGSPPS